MHDYDYHTVRTRIPSPSLPTCVCLLESRIESTTMQNYNTFVARIRIIDWNKTLTLACAKREKKITTQAKRLNSTELLVLVLFGGGDGGGSQFG